SAAWDDPALLEVGEHLPHALLDALGVGAEGDFGVERRLVRRRDASEFRNLSGTGLLVEPRQLALLADLQRTVDHHLDEVAGLHEGAHLVAVGAVGRDEGSQRDDAGVGEQLRHLADAADVLGPVGGREAEVLVEAVADVVTVEDEGVHTPFPQRLLERHRDGGLPRAGEPGEPDGRAAVTGESGTRPSGSTPAQHGHPRSSSSSSGGPLRTFADASAMGSESTLVARSSRSFGARTSRHRPGTTCSTIASRAASRSAGSVTSAAVPRITTER